MLILTRRVGETLIIAGNIEITVLGLKGNQVRIGVNAPKDVPVYREELYERMQEDGQETHIQSEATTLKKEAIWLSIDET